MKHLGTMAMAATLCVAALSQPGLAQVAAPSILQIDIANHVLYFNDTSDVTNMGLIPTLPSHSTQEVSAGE